MGGCCPGDINAILSSQVSNAKYYTMRAEEFSQPKKNLVIFDIDDTLMHTTAKIKVVRDGKVVRELTNQEFNNYKLQPGEQFDFGEFRSAEKFNKESTPIEPMMNRLKDVMANSPNAKVIMLTARADFDDKEKFLDTFRRYGIDMSRVHVHRAGNLPGDAIPAEKKAVFVRDYLNTGKYKGVWLYDDSNSNLAVFKELKNEYPEVAFHAIYVGPGGSTTTVESSIDEEYNSRVFRRGFEKNKDYGRYTLKATPGYFRLGQKINEPSSQFRIEARLGKALVGWVNFEVVGDHLEAMDLNVEKTHRRKGLATAMYRFAQELENDIMPSDKQTELGRAFWATKSPVDPQGNTKAIQESISIADHKDNFVEMFKKFLPVAMKYIGLDSLPKMKFEIHVSDTHQPTFGKYSNNNHILHVALMNRHPNDILRTVAHELTHYRQDLDDELNDDSGNTGSPHENEANALSGIIMRHFNKKYPEYLNSKPITE